MAKGKNKRKHYNNNNIAFFPKQVGVGNKRKHSEKENALHVETSGTHSLAF